MTNLDSILKSRDITLPTKGHLVKTMVFPVVMYGWELDHKESWAPKNWYFWTVVLEKTLESPLGYKEIKPVHTKGNQSWILIGRTDSEAETPILWPPNAKNWQEKGITGEEIVGWHHQLDWHEFEKTAGVGNGQGSLVCCSPWGCKKSDTTERLNWTDCMCFKYLLAQ